MIVGFVPCNSKLYIGILFFVSSLFYIFVIKNTFSDRIILDFLNMRSDRL